nr:6600_t:CDS:1 [Entrophospora candida]
MNLEQRDKEKTNLIAKLDDDIKEIKQSLANTSISPEINSDNIPGQMENTSDNAPNFDVCQETKTQCSASSICIETKSSENKEINNFLDSLHKEKVRSQDLSLDNNLQSNKNKVQKFMLEISENSNLQLQYTGFIINGNVDIDMTPTLNETESQPSNDNFTLLYEKLCDAIILADCKTQEAVLCYCLFGKALMQRRNEIASEKQVDPESNIVSRILNKEVHAQLPANTSDALLWKRIEKAKKLYKLFNAIGMDNIY